MLLQTAGKIGASVKKKGKGFEVRRHAQYHGTCHQNAHCYPSDSSTPPHIAPGKYVRSTIKTEKTIFSVPVHRDLSKKLSINIRLKSQEQLLPL